MKIAGWLWAWLRTYTDWVRALAGFTCFLMYLATWWGPFLVAAAVLASAALTAAWFSEGRLRSVWLRLPWVMKCRRRKHGQWATGHPSVRAATQREIQMLQQWWDLPTADDEVRKEQQ